MKPSIIEKTYGSEKWNTIIDYSQTDNWLALPKNIDKNVDVIYFYPTTFGKKAPSAPNISDIDDINMRDGAKHCLATQASVFEEGCNIFAPYYRQVSADYALTLTTEETNEILAYSASQDPSIALDYYFEHYNNGRPFILAGHSQGANILVMLLANYFKDHPEHYSKMIAAYAIGYSVTKEYLQENKHLKFAQEANDIGVIISYNTEGSKNKGHHNAVVAPGAISINPLNWKLDETPASVEENIGSLNHNGVLVEGFADAQIDLNRGVVVCSSADPKYYAVPAPGDSLFGPESYHAYDYGFYYMNLRQNVTDRITAWFTNISETSSPNT